MLSKIEKSFEKLIAMATSGSNVNEMTQARKKAAKIAKENGYDLDQEIKCYKKFATIDREKIELLQLHNGTAFTVPPLWNGFSKLAYDAALEKIANLEKEITTLRRENTKLKNAKKAKTPKAKKATIKPRNKKAVNSKPVLLLELK